MQRCTTLNIVGFSRQLTNFQNTRCPEQAGHYYLSSNLSFSASSRDFSHKPSCLVHHKYLFVTDSHFLHIMVCSCHTAHHHSHCLTCPLQYLVFPLAQSLGTTLMLEVVCSSKTVVLTNLHSVIFQKRVLTFLKGITFLEQLLSLQFCDI